MTDSVAAHVLRPVTLRLPFWRYLEIYAERPYTFLLDSAGSSERLGRYSYLGADPFLTFEAKRLGQRGGKPHLGRVQIHEHATQRTTVRDDCAPFEVLREVLARYQLPADVYVGRPAPFLGGAVGYFGYEAGYFLEQLPDRGLDDLALPDICFSIYDAVLIHDHASGKTLLSVVARGASSGAAREAAEDRADEVCRQLMAFESCAPADFDLADEHAASLLVEHADAATYGARVEAVREHILSGDAFEVCLTHRMDVECRVDPFRLYAQLHESNPAPFAAYLSLPQATVVSASPERFLKLDADRTVESRPIKGTRPRGETLEDDHRMYADLVESTKDQAENNMIVDLVRNDLSRVCKTGSVTVSELRAIEWYPTVLQMVSTIRGMLRDDMDAIDLICSSFPGGSMTGAPKIEAMKIIDSLEPVKRGIYSGAIGFLDFTGPMDLNIVIRTVVVTSERATVGVGGAVVLDSDPLGEYHETLDKARALIDALRKADVTEVRHANTRH
jgi:para-aminobenzoate synthetase component I